MHERAKPTLDNLTATISGSSATHRHTPCASCHRRNAECDGKYPCLKCAKEGVDSQLDRHRSVRSGVRRTESPGSSSLALRLHRYEHLLRTHGIDLDGRSSGYEEAPARGTDPASIQTDSGVDTQSAYVGSAHPYTSANGSGAWCVMRQASRYVETSVAQACVPQKREDSAHTPLGAIPRRLHAHG